MDYYKLQNKITELKEFSEKGLTDLKTTGISCLDPLWMLKKGYPIFIAGNPGAGKTEFCFEVLVNTSIMYGWKHFIYCGEGGNIEHIYHELLHKFLGKPYKWADEKEKIKAEYFVDTHFVIANHDIDFSIDDFYKLVEKCERELLIKFDTTVFDPFNDVKDESDKFGGREDKYLAYALKKVRISSKINNRIDILINHVADVMPKIDKDTGNSYLPPALPTQWAGGRTWWRRAFTMILIYKPYTWMKDNNGMPYADNEGHVIIQKSKPKGVGRIGKASIFWDWKKNRYYCYHGSQELYSCETIEKYMPKSLVETVLQPNKDFTEVTKYSEEMPF
ncbi:MAG: hypothetical protein V4608_10850 [Bacteroidota bacterium]